MFRVGTVQTGKYLDIELGMRHEPLIINESGCNANTKPVSTPREKLQDTSVLDGRKSTILKGEDATRCRSACVRLSYLAHHRLDFAETAKHLAQRMCEPREFNLIPLQRDIWLGNPKLHCDFEDKNTLTKSPSSWTANQVAIQSGEKTLQDWWLRSVITP